MLDALLSVLLTYELLYEWKLESRRGQGTRPRPPSAAVSKFGCLNLDRDLPFSKAWSSSLPSVIPENGTCEVRLVCAPFGSTQYILRSWGHGVLSRGDWERQSCYCTEQTFGCQTDVQR